MSPDLSTARIYTDFQGLSDLRRAAKENSDEALEEVAAQFEAIFIQMMLKSMRDASLSEGIFDSDQSEMYMGMFDQQIALDLSSNGAFGIAEMLVQQLANNRGNERIPIVTSQVSAIDKSKIEITKKQNVASEFGSPRAFIDFMRPQAEQAANKLGIKAEILIAQAALETGWGQKIIKRTDGSSSYNLFGIKAGRSWSGESTTVSTLEYRDGVMHKEPANFRSYDSFQQSFDDYVEFVKQGAHYQQALKHDGDARRYIHSLQDAGYASDPMYAEKVIDIMDRELG
jgi:flagellar protein FlgJ